MYEDVIKIHWILSVKLPAPTLLYITEKMHNKTGNSAFTAEFEQSVLRQGVPYQGPKREQNIEEWLTKWLLSSLATPVINDCLAIKYNTRQIRALKQHKSQHFLTAACLTLQLLYYFCHPVTQLSASESVVSDDQIAPCSVSPRYAWPPNDGLLSKIWKYFKKYYEKFISLFFPKHLLVCFFF